MIKTLGGTLRVAMTIGAFACAATPGQAAPGCIFNAPVRLVCDQDGCVRPASETDCGTITTALARPAPRPRRLTTPVRVERDELAMLLARLD